MKRIIKKVHHFTRKELAAEEVAVILLCCLLFAAASYAAGAFLPIRVKILQCGAKEHLPAKCREDPRCCALLDPVDSRALAQDPDDAGQGGALVPMLRPPANLPYNPTPNYEGMVDFDIEESQRHNGEIIHVE